MYKNVLKFFLILSSVSFLKAEQYHYDLTILGEIDYEGSLTRVGLNLVEILGEHLSVSYIRTPRAGDIRLGPVSNLTKQIILNSDDAPGKVVLLVETLARNVEIHKQKKGIINIAYSMLESDRIPDDWVERINEHFDAVVVPDNFLIDVYKNSGVQVPVFVIPVPMDLDNLLVRPLKSKAKKPFTFGVSATYIDRKNNEKLFDAFIQAFGNNKDFRLKIHGRYDDARLGIYKRLLRKKRKLKLTNVEFIKKPISQKEYIEFLESLDCYVSISKGEGFSLTPREAMALGIPSILTDNTGQSTICRSGLVNTVSSTKKVPFYFIKDYLGYCYDCKIEDVISSMQEIYNKYSYYLQLGQKSREWVRQYHLNEVGKLFLSLVKPKKVTLGAKDKISEDGVTTSSEKLYSKYMKVISSDLIS